MLYLLSWGCAWRVRGSRAASTQRWPRRQWPQARRPEPHYPIILFLIYLLSQFTSHISYIRYHSSLSKKEGDPFQREIRDVTGRRKWAFMTPGPEAHFWSFVVCARPKSGEVQSVCRNFFAPGRAIPPRKRIPTGLGLLLHRDATAAAPFSRSTRAVLPAAG